MPSEFVHLHNHTEYSLLDGLSKVSKLVLKAKELEMPALAITDHGNMYGAIEFYKTCQKEHIKPLIGVEGYITNGDHTKKSGREDRENHHLVLIAKNFRGYQNLMKLTTIAHLEGFYYRPRFSKEMLQKYSQDLICLSACPKGEIGQLLIENKYDQAKNAAAWYQQVFNRDYFLEIQRHQNKDYYDTVKDNPKLLTQLENFQKSEDVWVKGIISISRDLGIRLVATNDTHYLNQTDAKAQDVLVCISTGKQVSDTDRMRYVDTPTFHLRSSTEMSGIFSDLPDAITNTLKVAEKVDIQIELGKWYFPEIEIPDKKTAPQYLLQTVTENFKKRIPDADQVTCDRLDFELDIITKKGYAPYFLMMADMVNWCTGQGIITNTRGSAAGSLVSYVLGITTVDPIKYGLPFERFLNPLRPKPPDIDLDIADDRREELITQVTQKYGSDKVAQICTFGRMLARASVRDVGRVLGHPYSFPDRIAKLIPLGSQGFPMTIQKALEVSPELKVLYDTDPQAKQLLDLAQEIEGNARHASVHAAGLVVSPSEMIKYSPLQLEPNGTKIITQYEMHACEDVGLVKFDILGIRNLSILGAARDLIEKSRGNKIDLAQLPINDKKTYTMLSRGETMGVFQLGGSGMTKWLMELKPNRLEDIMVMIALFRPGPMANIPEYISRKNKRSSVTYIHPKMEKYLDKSYGILVYQEDVLFTALELAGYDWGAVDALRQAIGKKKPKEMAQQHDIFVKGCIQNSKLTEIEAEKIWELFVPFQGYGFNKAHAASYGIVSYQTAYLKANYPVEYMTALLTAESGNTDKVVEAVEECKRMKIFVLPPDINHSDTKFTIEENVKSLDSRAIRFGLSAIKNVGEAAIAAIFSARSSGEFISFTDFCLRVDSQKVNRKVLESLIKSGSMDAFGRRSAMLSALDKIRELGTSISKLKSSGQESLFGDSDRPNTDDHLPEMEEFEKTKKLEMEKELLGFYLTEHPHAEKLSQIGNVVSHRISQLYAEDYSNQTVSIGGIIESCRQVMTKNGNLPMCFAKISDLGKSIEATVFPRVYAVTTDVWRPDNLVVLSGKVEPLAFSPEEETDNSKKTITMVVNSAAIFTGPDTILPQISSVPNTNRLPDNHHPRVISIYIPKSTPSARLVSLNSLLQLHKGNSQAQLVFAANGSSRSVPLPYGLDWNEDLKQEIDSLLNN